MLCSFAAAINVSSIADTNYDPAVAADQSTAVVAAIDFAPAID